MPDVPLWDFVVDGMSQIDLVREVPEAMKPRRIAINGQLSSLDQKKAA